MKIHLKKVLVSLLVIVGFVSYALYQRYFNLQQVVVNDPSPDTVADVNTSETVSTTTVSQEEIESLTNEDDDDNVSQQTAQATSGSSSSTMTSADSTSASTSSAATTSASSSTTAGAAAANALYLDGQYDGNAADAYYGLIQVRAIVQNGKLTDIEFLSYPNDRSKSVQINTYATPILKAEAIKSQSAKVNIVTGATNTSRAFINSLSSALNQAQV
jgi:uncharacterized protein with FMN-binding domain